MTEFKQIIGRGTRVRDDYGKLWFSILDYTGSATRLFADPDFDGDPARLTQEEIDAEGKQIKPLVVEQEQIDPEIVIDGDTPLVSEGPEEERRKFYFDGGRVEIATHLVYELDPDGKQLRVVRYSEYAAEKVRSLCPSAPELHAQWSDPIKRAEIIERLAERGIGFDQLAEHAQQPEADPFDLLCHVAYNAPLRTRRERAQRLKSERKDFFAQFGPEARQILDELRKIRRARQCPIHPARRVETSSCFKSWPGRRHHQNLWQCRGTARSSFQASGTSLRRLTDQNVVSTLIRSRLIEDQRKP
jgi:type I restriction enzyme R subunit